MTDRDLEAFLKELAALNVKLWADNGVLRYSAPESAVSPTLHAELAARKTEIVEFLDKIERRQGARGRSFPERAPQGTEIPLTPGQKRIWSLEQMRLNSGAYNVAPVLSRLRGPVNVEALEKSLSEIQRRHEILRTRFPSRNGTSYQSIGSRDPVVLHHVSVAEDFAALAADKRERFIRELLDSEVQRSFDVENGPLWRATLHRLASYDYILTIVIHHIIFDGTSRPVLLRELSLFYKIFALNEGAPLPDLPLQYADFAYWQNQKYLAGDFETELAYWKNQFESPAPELRLPTDHARTSERKREGANCIFPISGEQSMRVSAIAREGKASIYMVLLAAFYALLHRYTNQSDLLICAPMESRECRDLDEMIGYFNNIVVLRGDLSGDPTFMELLARVRRTVMDAQANQHIPLQNVAQLDKLVRVPVTRCMVALRDSSTDRLELPRVSVESIRARRDVADFDLALYFENKDGHLHGLLEYSTSLFKRDTIAQLIANLRIVLEQITSRPDDRVSSLPWFGLDTSTIAEVLKRHPGIDEAVVVEKQDCFDTVAYVVLNQEHAPSLDEVRRFAMDRLPERVVPAVIRPLDELPLDDGGNFSQLSLASMLKCRETQEQSWTAPRTALEHKLARIWRKVLWLERDVGLHEDFLDLGGHSLLAVQLVTEIESELKVTLPLHLIPQLTTISELAQALEQDEGPKAYPSASLPEGVYRTLRSHTSAWSGCRTSLESLMVGLNISGSGQSLFWCLQKYRELQRLAEHLGKDQPVYGLRSTSKILPRTPGMLKILASHYADEIQMTQPEGPYLLGGNCAGARVAFYVAKELMERGCEINMLCLLEKFIPQPYEGRIALLFGSESRHNPYRFYSDPEYGWRKFYSGDMTVDITDGRHGAFFDEPNVQSLTRLLRQRIHENRHGVSPSRLITGVDCYQRLPDGAYKAKIKSPRIWNAAPGERRILQVHIQNKSSITWQAGNASGIFLANRWLDAKGKVSQWLDGRVPIPRSLAPGSIEDISLPVRIPSTPGHWKLELDLVDEGVCWFGSMGSRARRLRVRV